MTEKLTPAALKQMKRDGRKIAAVVCWDSNTAEVADAAGIDIVSVGDSAAPSLDELLVFCGAVRRGVKRALVSCDLPAPSVEAAQLLVAAGVGGGDHDREVGVGEVGLDVERARVRIEA